MKTVLLKADFQSIRKAAKIIKSGGIVAFPTETVYGLGANALNSAAVRKIFAAKKRPSDNPLIVHVSSIAQARYLAKSIPKKAGLLMNEFWPGPLTLVLKKSKKVSVLVTAGLDSVAIRMPANKIAISLIEESGFPIAAPSANLSKKPSPTTALDVLEDLNGRVPLILDGGWMKIGLESTVLDLTSKTPTILRPGAITLEDLRKVLGIVKLHFKKSSRPKSPGLMHKHYAPKAKVLLFVGERKKALSAILKKRRLLKKQGFDAGVISNQNNKFLARGIFKRFRKLDREKKDYILVAGILDKGLGLAVMDRLKRAAFKTIKC